MDYISGDEYENTLISALASTFDVLVEDVNIISVSPTDSRRLLRRDQSGLAIESTAGISVVYELKFRNTDFVYEDISALISTSINELADNLNKYAYINGAYEFLGTEPQEPEVQDITPSNDDSRGNDDDSNLSDGAIAGIVIGSVIFAALLAGITYFMVIGGGDRSKKLTTIIPK